MHSNHLEDVLNHSLLGLTPRIPDPVDLRICLSNKFPVEADAAGPGTTL